jgi:DNA-directed RNA polymerase specialized sigma24 family protein
MQTLERPEPGVNDLYWLAYLITGSRETGLDVAVEAIDSQDTGNGFFSTWMLAWSRRVVIAKALTAMSDQLSASAGRIAKRTGTAQLPPRSWSMDGSATKAQIERALLAIDVFPRVALLLGFFERIALEDAAILLDASLELVRKAQRIGLRELTRNLALMQGWTSDPVSPFPATGEAQPA